MAGETDRTSTSSTCTAGPGWCKGGGVTFTGCTEAHALSINIPTSKIITLPDKKRCVSMSFSSFTSNTYELSPRSLSGLIDRSEASFQQNLMPVSIFLKTISAFEKSTSMILL